MKKYEDFINRPLYNIGDYVYFWKQISKKKILTGKVKIIDIEYVDFLKEYQYIAIDGISEDKPIGQTGSVISGEKCFLEKDIKRKLTPYEIEEFEAKSNTKKYNL
jgi:hypothetical protein